MNKRYHKTDLICQTSSRKSWKAERGYVNTTAILIKIKLFSIQSELLGNFENLLKILGIWEFFSQSETYKVACPNQYLLNHTA
jgi:hypothetical protein